MVIEKISMVQENETLRTICRGPVIKIPMSQAASLETCQVSTEALGNTSKAVAIAYIEVGMAGRVT